MARKITTQSAGQSEASTAQASKSADAQPGSPEPSAAELSLPLGSAGETKIETVASGADGAGVTDLTVPVEDAAAGQVVAGAAAAGSETPLNKGFPETGGSTAGESTDVDAADTGGIDPDSVHADADADADEDASVDTGVESPANANPLAVQIYPLRSYMDAGELRRRGGGCLYGASATRRGSGAKEAGIFRAA